jgi:hypothetical protein
MNEQEGIFHHVKLALSWISAALGAGTVAGFVNLAVGVLSAGWLGYQLYVAITVELPIKRARLQEIRKGRRDPAPSDQGPLE